MKKIEQNKLLNPLYYKKLHQNVHGNFLKKAKAIVQYNKINKTIPALILEPIKKFNNIKFHPLKFYLVEMLDEYLLLEQFYDDSELDEMFDYWTESEFAKTFLESLNRNGDIKKSSKICQDLLLRQIIAFYKIHFQNSKIKQKNYNPIKEIGDYLDEKGKLHHFDFGEIRSLDLEKGIYPFLSFITPDKKNQARHLKKTAKALELIKNYSPASYKAFCDFTHTIIPIEEKGIVSYSSSKLPGYSLINIYHRDFVDLLDDLIHENGHHYLNYFLYIKKLINEDQEKIFYSPWRKQLRPIRGIYHAVFTFFWGMNLFSDIDQNLVIDKTNFFKLSVKEKIKVKQRYLEEYLMIEFSLYDLKVAHELGKVTKQGMDLVQELDQMMKRDKKRYQMKKKELGLLSKSALKEINKQEVHLTKMAKTYRFKY